MAESKLLKLKTDLKSLKFDPNSEPYVLFPIGYTKSFEKNDSIPQSITDYYLSNRTNSDFPLRGGTINLDLRTQTFTRASQIDKERIRKFLNDDPKGPMFLRKQVGLQLSNPKIETANILPALSNAIENTRFYNNGLNTLTQVGVQGTGLHALRHGTVPFNITAKAYYDTVNEQNVNNSYESNRLVSLKYLKLSKNTSERFVLSTAAKLGISLSQNNLFQYLGGPDSVYGVGITTIRRYDDTELGTQRLAEGPNSSKYSDAVKRKYSDIDMESEKYSTMRGGVQTYTQEDRFGTGDPGNKSGLPGIGTDKLSANTLLYYDASKAPWENQGVYTNDIIKFVFEAIDNDNPDNATAVFFRAFLSGMSDNHNASITAFKYLGRGEDFYTYQGVSREIGFSFKISPQSEKELAPLYKKLNFLISQVYPDYSAKNKIMRAPLVRLTIGDYFYRLPGLIQSINVSVDDNSPWEISSEDVYEEIDVQTEYVDLTEKKLVLKSRLRQLPQVINVQCTFKPIHDFLPQRETYSVKIGEKGEVDTLDNMRVPFIVNDTSDFIRGDVTVSDGIRTSIEESEKIKAKEQLMENVRTKFQSRIDQSFNYLVNPIPNPATTPITPNQSKRKKK